MRLRPRNGMTNARPYRSYRPLGRLSWRPLSFQRCDVASWHEPAVHDVHSNVGNRGLSGLVMLTLSFADPGPLADMEPDRQRASLIAVHSATARYRRHSLGTPFSTCVTC